MQEDFAQRRRVAVAIAITVILVPAVFLLNRGGDDAAGEPTGTLVGDVLIPGQPSEPAVTPVDAPTGSTDPMGTTPSEFIDGTVPEQADDPATIAIPRATRAVRGTATFSRGIADTATCQIRDLVTIPFNSSVTVTNLDNSRSVQCIASIGGEAPDDDIIMNADAFLQIGDLTDAPLSVEISW
ncbi:hypothetical protein [Ilumatobacter sp.]|uniref:hypothetical protein n=1 Tax=Ilumatobacter sp. TaxID=1967498 RepID=UPI003AF9BA8C